MAHPSGNPDRPSVMQAFSGLSNDEFEILGNADRFAQAELYPLAQRRDDEEWWPTEIFPKIGANGYFGVTAPEAHGGDRLDERSEERREGKEGERTWRSRGERAE